jgi:hypothetical protein
MGYAIPDGAATASRLPTTSGEGIAEPDDMLCGWDILHSRRCPSPEWAGAPDRFPATRTPARSPTGGLPRAGWTQRHTRPSGTGAVST